MSRMKVKKNAMCANNRGESNPAKIPDYMARIGFLCWQGGGIWLPHAIVVPNPGPLYVWVPSRREEGEGKNSGEVPSWDSFMLEEIVCLHQANLK